MSDAFTQGRGHPWEYDPGPPRNRRWPRLFAETPNYRAIGVEYTGHEEYRWHQGPMFYRGRLGDNQVKVLIVGQEGAQDESLSHRSFTGGTGARMQHYLNHMGITRSYLFLNTFVYPIFGQYNGKLPVLAQHDESPIAAHRHEIFDYALSRNDLRLVIAVGKAAKESIATWIRSHGGNARPDRLHLADHDALGRNVRTLGLLHPGSQSAELEEKFRAGMRQIERWERDAPGWLPEDRDGERRPAAEYRYRSAPIPFRDFAYGTTWRLGRGGTSSNRARDQRSIQIFGSRGRYNNRSISYSRQASSSRRDEADVPSARDLPYEPPKTRYTAFDRGPSRSWARLLQGGASGLPWPDFEDLGLKADPAFGMGPGYRGRLVRGSLVVVADQHSVDDQFMGRALCGDVGQHLQAFLRAAGLTHRYAIVRTLPVHTLEDSASAVRRAVDHEDTRAIHHEILRRLRPPVIVTLGSHAARVVADEAPSSARIVELPHFNARSVRRMWSPVIDELADLRFPKDIRRPANRWDGEREPIARHDLPYGTLWWQGGTGDRAQQGKTSRTRFTPDYFRVVMPTWAANLDPTALSRSEERAVRRLP